MLPRASTTAASPSLSPSHAGTSMPPSPSHWPMTASSAASRPGPYTRRGAWPTSADRRTPLRRLAIPRRSLIVSALRTVDLEGFLILGGIAGIAWLAWDVTVADLPLRPLIIFGPMILLGGALPPPPPTAQPIGAPPPP